MKRRVFHGMVLFFASATVFLGRGRADDKADEKFSDQHFVQKASAAGLAEVGLGRLAAERASRAEVKQFGQRMVQDHTKANTELLQIADAKKLQPAQQMDAEHRDLLTKLAGKSGPEFDQIYLKHMVMDHEKAVLLFTKASQQCQDADLKGFAAKTLPTVQEHLQMAKRLANQAAAGSRSSN
jgi:putative membrane protein